MNPKKVAILAYPNLCTFEFGCAVELFALPRAEVKNWYKTEVVALKKGTMTATGGFQIQSNNVFSSQQGFKGYDMLIIPGWSGLDVDAPEPLIKAIQVFYQNGGVLVSFCSGAFVIAQTGLINRKEATTHWKYEEHFKQKFPLVRFLGNVLYSESDRLYTSAGSASALDLGLHIIRKDYGSAIANTIAKHLLVSPQREGGQAQFSSLSKPLKNDRLSNALEWAMENLQHNISINEMAKCTHLSRRSFDRHFRSNLGLSPKEWLIRQRINLAREFLESSQADIEQIAEKSGFSSAINLRHHFRQVLGVSPSHYRSQFLQN